jgi:hypothetical protein
VGSKTGRRWLTCGFAWPHQIRPPIPADRGQRDHHDDTDRDADDKEEPDHEHHHDPGAHGCVLVQVPGLFRSQCDTAQRRRVELFVWGKDSHIWSLVVSRDHGTC